MSRWQRPGQEQSPTSSYNVMTVFHHVILMHGHGKVTRFSSLVNTVPQCSDLVRVAANDGDEHDVSLDEDTLE